MSVALFSCNDHRSNNVRVSEPNVVVNPTTAAVGDNLDLQALGQLVQTSSSAQEIENKLNTDGSINNLDLNGDGVVDYIKVSEFGDGSNRGFSFTVDMPDGSTSEVATIDIEQGNGVANMNIHGNRDYYGDNAYYQSSHALRDLMIMNYLFSYHRPYYSPYHYGYYPSTYRSYRSVPTTTYRTKTVTRTIKSTPSRSTLSSTTRPTTTTKAVTPATSRTSTLSSPTRSQKSFTTTSPANARPVTTGFGNRKSTPTTTTTSRPRSTSSWGPSSNSSRRSSGSSWGSSSSSSRKSSGSSWGSSSSSRRSSGFGSSSRSSSRSSRH